MLVQRPVTPTRLQCPENAEHHSNPVFGGPDALDRSLSEIMITIDISQPANDKVFHVLADLGVGYIFRSWVSRGRQQFARFHPQPSEHCKDPAGCVKELSCEDIMSGIVDRNSMHDSVLVHCIE